MKTATKSSWSKVAQDLCGRWFVQEFVQREKAANKETNKHKNGSLSPPMTSYFLPNFRLTFPNFLTFPQKCCQTWDQFLSQDLLKTIRATQVFLSSGGCLISVLWPALPAEWKQAFALALCYKGWDCIESRHKGQRLMATSLTFPSGLHVSKRYELISIFLEKKTSFCDADESRQETWWNQWDVRLCGDTQSIQTGKLRSYTIHF